MFTIIQTPLGGLYNNIIPTMQITEEYLKKFFTKDNRFIHFSIRRAGYHFQNDEDVEETRFISINNIMLAVNKKKEFENEPHIVGYTMTLIQHAFLSMLKRKKALKRSLDIKNEAQLTYGDGDEAYSKYLSSAVTGDGSHNDEFNHVNLIAKSILSEEEYDMLMMHGYHGFTYTAIHKKYPHRSLESTRAKITRIKKIIQKNVKKESEIVDIKSSEGIVSEVQEPNRGQSDAEKQKEKYNHLKALHIISLE